MAIFHCNPDTIHNIIDIHNKCISSMKYQHYTSIQQLFNDTKYTCVNISETIVNTIIEIDDYTLLNNVHLHKSLFSLFQIKTIKSVVSLPHYI